MKAAIGRTVVAILVLTLVLLSLTARFADPVEEVPQVSEPYVQGGEALWWSLPPELLSDVAEGIMEQISDLNDDLARVREIQHIRAHEMMQQTDME